MGLRIKISRSRNKGVAMIISMMFLIILSAMALGMVTMAQTNVRCADNDRNVSRAVTTAESGLEFARYWLSDIIVSGDVDPENRLQSIAGKLWQKFYHAELTSVIASCQWHGSETPKRLTISNITVDSDTSQSFDIELRQTSDDILCLDITGNSGNIENSNNSRRVIRVKFNFITVGNPVFDFGVASKGPLDMSGQALIEGENLAIEASAYIEGYTIWDDAFTITSNARVDGDVTIANPYASYDAHEKAIVGGATGEEIDEHIHVGCDYIEFPVPNPDDFRDYATGDHIDSNTTFDKHDTFTNIIVDANTNPTFASDTTINGIIFVEKPNKISFAGKCTINGMIVADGERDEESSDCTLKFSGQVVANGVEELEGEEFDAIKEKTGTFILAPGYELEFSGQANQINGAIAGNGIKFSGQAGGSVKGSIINYSHDPMVLGGQSNLVFDRSGITADPAGFEPNYLLEFQPASYSETPLPL